jgi:hypothetical protein
MGISRIVSTDFWEDGLVNDSFSPEDKYFMLYLMTNPHSKQAGIYKLNKKIAAFELGYSVESVSALLDRFENKYHRIIYSTKEQEIAVLNAPKYNIVKGGKPVLDCIEKDLSQVKDKSLISRMYQHLKTYFDESDKPSIQQVGGVWKKASDTFKEVNDNDNDNDNDRIVDVSCDESYHESLPEENKLEDKSSRSRTSPIPYEKVASLYSTICTSYSKLAKLSDARKKAIHARFNSGYELDDFKRLFEMAEESSFLKGKNDRHWHATFDWLIKDTNMAKVLEGNYADDKSKLSAGSNDSGSHTGNKKGWGGYLC